jgi:hypothetical protein
MTLDDDILAEIRFRVAQGFDNREAAFRWILANYPAELGIEAEEYDARDLPPESRAALREAIEEAFTEKADDMKSWPEQTDCERLRAAFDALDRQGIVAMENAGLTQDDSIPRAADLALARDELGAQTHGYCLFTWNNMAQAIEGDGLSLAYGTFEQEAELTDEETSELATKVGAAVLQACREAGLDAEWTGSADDFVELPGFRWQRRSRFTSESDVRDFLDGWEVEVRAGYTPAGDLLDLLDERALDWFERFSDYGPQLFDRLREHTVRLLEEEKRRESTWSETTVNDRIASAFDELNQRGVLAREALGLTIQDGWGHAGLQAESTHRGVVFFHHEDVIDAVSGRGLLLAFGAIGIEPEESDSASLALGREVCAVLARHRIPATWSGSSEERIRITPFEWQRRRWTEATPAKPLEVAPEAPEPMSSPTATNAGSSVSDLARQCGIVVQALRDESSFDVKRSRQLRAAWKELGKSGEAQAGHLGLPHVFVPTGEWTTMLPHLAIANLPGAGNENFQRAVEIRRARIDA